MRHRPELDGVRGLAILLVLADHLNGSLRGGWVGVDLFFALSGYLITSLLLSEHERTGRIDRPAFYRRRVARLLPALVVALTVQAVAIGLWHRELLGLTIAGSAAALLYVANFAMSLAPGLQVGASWAWSLGLEEQFYLAWPSLLRRWLPKLTRREIVTRLLLAAVVIVALRSVVLPWSLGVGYGLTRGDEVILGCCAALVPVWRRWLGWASVATLAVVAVMVPSTSATWFGVFSPFASVAAVGVVLAASHEPLLRYLFASRLLRHVGAISYSLYLWNVVIRHVFWPLGRTAWPWPVVWLAATFAAAECSTWLIERPAQHWLRVRRAARPTGTPGLLVPRSRKPALQPTDG